MGRTAHAIPAAMPKAAKGRTPRRPKLPLEYHVGDDYTRITEPRYPTELRLVDVYESEATAATSADVAAFFVQAANNHDGLLLAAEEAVAAAASDDLHAAPSPVRDAAVNRVGAAVEALKIAIARAKIVPEAV